MENFVVGLFLNSTFLVWAILGQVAELARSSWHHLRNKTVRPENSFCNHQFSKLPSPSSSSSSSSSVSSSRSSRPIWCRYEGNVKNLADSNKRISEVLEEEFEDGGCLADYDKNEVKHFLIRMMWNIIDHWSVWKRGGVAQRTPWTCQISGK